MPTYEVIYDLAVPTAQTTYEGRAVTETIRGGEGNTVEMNEVQAAPLVNLGILAVPEVVEQTRKTRERVVSARQRAEDARQSAAVAEDEASTIEREIREEAASRVPSKTREI